MDRLSAFLIVVAASLTVVQIAAADQEPDVRVLPCRPTISCSADLVPPGALEIEWGYATSFVRNRGFVHAQPLLIKLTLLPWLQAQAGTNGLLFKTGDVSSSLYYFDDFTFALKAHLVDQSPSRPSVAVSAGVNAPSFDGSNSSALAYGASFWAYVSKDFGSPSDVGSVHVDLNGGANIWGLDTSQGRTQFFGTLAASMSLPLHLGSMVELYDFSDAGRIAPKDSGLLMGVSYSPKPSVMFDLGGDVGNMPSTRKFTLFVGVTFVPVRLWNDHSRALEEPRSALSWQRQPK